MKIFTVGPVAAYPCTKEINLKEFPYFRSESYSETVKYCLKYLNRYIGHSEDDSMIYLTCSGTGAMDAVVDNCVSDGDISIVINGGTFGHRFCEILGRYNKKYVSLNLNWNEELTEQHLEKIDRKDIKFIFVNVHETSSGHLYDISILSKFAKKNGLFLIVDAISSILADSYQMDANGIDVTIFSSQKGLCLSPGLSFVALSDRMKNKVIEENNSKSYYFYFKDYLCNIQRGQTPFTPANNVIYELRSMIDYIESNGGCQKWILGVENKALYFRKKATDVGLEIPKGYRLSNALTPVMIRNKDAKNIYQYLVDHFQTYVNPCGGALAHDLIRVSHIGNTTFQDFDLLINEILEALEAKQ